MSIRFSLLLLVLGSVPSVASAQRTLAHDTLSMDTPSAVSCGFCGDEVIGVVFRELPGTGGIRDTDFPLGLLNVQVALADAMTDGTSCNTDTIGGVVMAAVEVWAGATPPSTLPAATVTFGMPWPGETLVWGSDAVPLTLSTPTVDGGVMFNLQFNAYEPVDDMGDPLTVIVPEGNSYLRVAVLLPGGGGNNTVCIDPVEVPGGFPLRDNDGRLADERSYIYAGGGVGWLWNETAGLNGDWAIRLSVDPMAAPRDAGMRDAGARDTGAPDAPSADVAIDGGTTPPAGGCACRASTSATPSGWWLLGLAAVLGRVVSARRRGAPQGWRLLSLPK